MSESKVSKKQQACVNRYIDKAYDRVNLTMPKGNKEAVSEHAKKRGESVNSFINRAIWETIERDEKNTGGQ
ncbi:MAG: hypothetical protein IJ457_07125 [Clostridia bacterium]|nr:hypothetical protein [Clostridia bacterium]